VVALAASCSASLTLTAYSGSSCDGYESNFDCSGFYNIGGKYSFSTGNVDEVDPLTEVIYFENKGCKGAQESLNEVVPATCYNIDTSGPVNSLYVYCTVYSHSPPRSYANTVSQKRFGTVVESYF
jgi:hypothetical protein